jgi:hypothetical protein
MHTLSKKNTLQRTIGLFQIISLLFITSFQSHAQCGYGLNFGGQKMDYLSGPYIADISNNFTIEFWVKPQNAIKENMAEATSGYKNGINGQSYAIWPNWHDGTLNESGAGVSVGTNGVAVFEHADAYMPALLVHYTPISNTQWTHIAVVYNDKLPSLYINGVFAKTGLKSTKNIVFPSTSISDNSHFVDYGSFVGSIDEIRVWSTPLTAEIISQWMALDNLSNHPDKSALYSRWKLDTGGGNTAYDETGLGHNGKLINGPLWGTGWQENFINNNSPLSITANSSSIYLGYGPQSITLTASEGDNLSWNGEYLSNTTAQSTIFSPTTAGVYHIILSATTKIGCLTTAAIDINVVDVRAPGGSKEPKIYICHTSSEKNEKSETVAVSMKGAREHLSKHPNDQLGKCSSTSDGEKKEDKEDKEDSEKGKQHNSYLTVK